MGPEPRNWVDRTVDVAGCHASRVNLEVDVSAKGPSGQAHRPDVLARRHSLAHADRDVGHMRQQRVGAIRMLDRDIVAGPAAGRSNPGVGDDPIRRSVQWGADGR